jgi:hypothetical protein
MYLRGLALASALLIPSPVAPANPLPMVIIQPAAIVQVVCYSKQYTDAGTAFRVGPDGLGLSVNHVTSSGNCYIDGKPLTLAYKSPKTDFSEVTLDDGPYLGIDCNGFVKGHHYIAIGYARGISPVTTLDLTATGQHDSNGQELLLSMVPVIPGMSGGPIIDADTGKVVGTVNAENFEEGLSWSEELKNEPVCRGPIT